MNKGPATDRYSGPRVDCGCQSPYSVAVVVVCDYAARAKQNDKLHIGEVLMILRKVLGAVALTFVFSTASADLTPWEDYQESEAVWTVTTIKVAANMGDAYLEGLKNTWVAGNEVALKLGQIEDYKIYRSDLPESGDFNLILTVKFKNTAELGPNQARYNAFMKEWGEKRNQETTEFAQKNYPAMREITGMYYMREITLK
jgi:hypothetical protein